MAIDWTKRLEAVNTDGRIIPVELDPNEQQPLSDGSGDYVIVDILDSGEGFGPSVFNPDGTPWLKDEEWTECWSIRNVSL